MSILENELIRKYFGCPAKQHGIGFGCGGCQDTAKRVLQAMEEPIKKGERVLWVHDGTKVTLENAPPSVMEPEGFHPHFLRLQEKKECNCRPFPECSCGMNCEKCHRTPPSPTAEKCDRHCAIDQCCCDCKPSQEKCNHGCKCENAIHLD